MKSQSGFSMIEVLVTIAILVFGLLGLAGLQTVTTTAQLEAYQRAQALVLLQDLYDRMSANKSNAASYIATDIGVTPVDCTGKTGPALDLCEWGNEVAGASEVTTGGTKTGVMIGGRGCIALVTPNVYRITVAWQGFSTAGTQAWQDCGAGAYGTGKRRTVSTVLRVGTLGAGA